MARVVARRSSDVISNLPENVIEGILVCLSTRDAARTSILSRRWRHRWAKLPQLILDETLWSKSFVQHSAARATVENILHQLLSVHEGLIKKFTLSVRELGSCSELDNLMLFLSTKGIEDLTLELSGSCKPYILPLSFLTCQQLRYLSLESCFIETTLALKGFSRLISLKLHRVTVGAKALGILISNCPLLELLDLQHCTYCNGTEIEIDAPILKTFSFKGTETSIIFRKVQKLASVSIVSDYHPYIIYLSQIGKFNLNEFFNGLALLEKLHLDFVFDKSLLPAGKVPKRLLTTLVYLKDLKLHNRMSGELDELSFVLCLIRSSPNLKHIDIALPGNITSGTNRILQVLKEQDYSDVTLNELTEVELKGVTGTRTQLKLIEILLAVSPSLKEMQLRKKWGLASTNELKLIKELTKFPRASKEAEVIYSDMNGNEVCLRYM